MSEQAMDLRRSVQIVRRHLSIVGISAALGLLAGAGYTAARPPMLASKVLVVLPPSIHDTPTEVVIASSDPVLSGALRGAHLGMSLGMLRSRIQVKSMASGIISIGADGQSAAKATSTANAVARSYVDYLGSGRMPGRAVQAQVLEPATYASGMPLAVQLLITAGLGMLVGLLAGAIIALGISRSDQRLRKRDEIADSIGAPVLASVPVGHPSGGAGWTKLLRDYEPGAVDAWRLRKALQYLSLADGDGGSSSLGVLSVSTDPKALALGPQLAVFAASLGIPTVLVVGPQQDAHATATLRAACSAPSAPATRSRNLRVAVSDKDDGARLSGTGLTVVVAVVDGQAPKVGDSLRTTATVLGVSAGGATAEQLARVAASAAADGRHIAGILVADPDAADHTTGRLPQLGRSAQRGMPTRLTGQATETSR